VKKYLLCLLVCLSTVHTSRAAEFNNGTIRLVLNEKKGTFSLFSLTREARNREASPFLSHRSSINVLLNDQAYTLGSSALFKARLGGTHSEPALIFEAENFLVTVVFSFVRTVSASLNNGVTITVNLKNTGTEPVQAALKIVLDTRKKGKQVLSTDHGPLTTETVFDKTSSERWWIAEDAELSLMGNIAGAVRPDTVQIAAIATLAGAKWKPQLGSKTLPNASGVGYYFDARALGPDQSVAFPFILALTDDRGFAAPAFFYDTIPDTLVLKQVTALLERSLAAENSIPDETLDALEKILDRFKRQYDDRSSEY
jgi:hypothetical protein